MFNDNMLKVLVNENAIIIQNHQGIEKKFPRCGITKIDMFLLDMAKRGKLDELL